MDIKPACVLCKQRHALGPIPFAIKEVVMLHMKLCSVPFDVRGSKRVSWGVTQDCESRDIYTSVLYVRISTNLKAILELFGPKASRGPITPLL
jgi:hypothetical protein